MPHKRNPVLSVLIRRAALTAPQLAAQLQVSAACTVDERSDGAWHAEWAAMRTLTRIAVVAGSQTTELLDGLIVDRGRMERTARAADADLLAEARSLAEKSGADARVEPSRYLGATSLIVDHMVDRANRNPKDVS
jgi:3-carboxy-cis,cis-muconate cycloisomerase